MTPIPDGHVSHEAFKWKKKRTSSPPGNSDTFWDIIRSQAVLWLTHLVTTELHISTSGWPSLAISIQKKVCENISFAIYWPTRSQKQWGIRITTKRGIMFRLLHPLTWYVFVGRGVFWVKSFGLVLATLSYLTRSKGQHKLWYIFLRAHFVVSTSIVWSGLTVKKWMKSSGVPLL